MGDVGVAASGPVSSSESAPVSLPSPATEDNTSFSEPTPSPQRLAPTENSTPFAAPTQTSPLPVAPEKDGTSDFCGGGHVGNGFCVDGTYCSEWGYCDCTEDHCVNGQVCGVAQPTSSYCGGGHVGNGMCIDGRCCSEWGYCDCTEKHCFNGQTCGGAPRQTLPSSPVSAETNDPSPRPTLSSAPGTSIPTGNNIAAATRDLD